MPEPHDQPDLPRLRSRIREIDDRLIQMMAERVELAREIGKLKLAKGLPIKDFRVEKEVIERSRECAKGAGLYADMAEEASRLLIKYAVMAQDEFHTHTLKRKGTAQKKILIVGGRGRMGMWLSEYFDSFGHVVRHFDTLGHSAETDSFPLVSDLAEAAHAHDVIVLSTPISETARVIEDLVACGTEALVFDICSLKTPLLAAIAGAEAAGMRITSIHPMFGPEVELLAGRNIVLCETTHPELTREAAAFFEDTTVNLLTLPLARHDELIGFVLGLSHLSNLIFARVLVRSGLSIRDLRSAASTTFNAQMQVVEPVVKENQDLYYEIQAENSFTPALIDMLRGEIEAYAETIDGRDKDGFKRLMEESRGYLG